MHDLRRHRVQSLRHLLDEWRHLLGRSRDHRLAQEAIHDVRRHRQNDYDDNDGLYVFDVVQDQVDHALGEPVAEEEKQRDAGNRIDGVGEEETREGQLCQARGEEDRRPDAGRHACEEQDLDAVVLEVLLDLGEALGRQHPGLDPVVLEKARPPESADAVEQPIADDHADNAHGEHDPPPGAAVSREGAADHHRQLFGHGEADPRQQDTDEDAEIAPAAQQFFHSAIIDAMEALSVLSLSPDLRPGYTRRGKNHRERLCGFTRRYSLPRWPSQPLARGRPRAKGTFKSSSRSWTIRSTGSVWRRSRRWRVWEKAPCRL